jgi:hypothetical protein
VGKRFGAFAGNILLAVSTTILDILRAVTVFAGARALISQESS